MLCLHTLYEKVGTFLLNIVWCGGRSISFCHLDILREVLKEIFSQLQLHPTHPSPLSIVPLSLPPFPGTCLVSKVEDVPPTASVPSAYTSTSTSTAAGFSPLCARITVISVPQLRESLDHLRPCRRRHLPREVWMPQGFYGTGPDVGVICQQGIHQIDTFSLLARELPLEHICLAYASPWNRWWTDVAAGMVFVWKAGERPHPRPDALRGCAE